VRNRQGERAADKRGGAQTVMMMNEVGHGCCCCCCWPQDTAGHDAISHSHAIYISGDGRGALDYLGSYSLLAAIVLDDAVAS